MNERQIKRKLEDAGHRVVDLARHMARDFPITEGSAETMLRELIAGNAWYPKYVDWLKTNYGVTVNKPSWAKPVRERMKAAA